ncbi:MAG TPA: MBL fold metallo-hydrolase [Streptosporangiaceae bacterium]|jgi:glyoxylase-like metal-dependent hydrolase (beta-lactamase superfamily II)
MTEEHTATGAQGGFTTGTPVAGTLDVTWIHGAAGEPPLQIHHYDEHTVILRQAKSVHYEAPFQFLLFGSERALLLDTGATADPRRFPLRETVDRLITSWLERHPREHYQLVVAHTHGHGDHVAGDQQFAGRPDTTVVGRELAAVQEHFGFTDWPGQIVTFDLGERVLEVTGSPGHHRAAITTYDPRTGFLLTGDSVLPGRLYVFDMPQFAASMDRLVAFAASRPVTHVLGCHIEMTRKPGRDFPMYARHQPAEHALQLTVDDLTAIRDAAANAGRRGVTRFDDFILYNQPRTRDMLALLGRGLVRKIR